MKTLSSPNAISWKKNPSRHIAKGRLRTWIKTLPEKERFFLKETSESLINPYKVAHGDISHTISFFYFLDFKKEPRSRNLSLESFLLEISPAHPHFSSNSNLNDWCPDLVRITKVHFTSPTVFRGLSPFSLLGFLFLIYAKEILFMENLEHLSAEKRKENISIRTLISLSGIGNKVKPYMSLFTVSRV